MQTKKEQALIPIFITQRMRQKRSGKIMLRDFLSMDTSSFVEGGVEKLILKDSSQN